MLTVISWNRTIIETEIIKPDYLYLDIKAYCKADETWYIVFECETTKALFEECERMAKVVSSGCNTIIFSREMPNEG
jgi:hypothetical protein